MSVAEVPWRTARRDRGDGAWGLQLQPQFQKRSIEHRQYINTFGQDMPEVKHWQWGATDAHAPEMDSR